MSSKLLLVGCGKMGGAMLQGWLAGEIAPADVVIVEPGEAQAAALRPLGVTVVSAPEDIPADFAPDIVILALKPQMMDAAMPHYGRYANQGAAYLSIAAGKTIAYFEGWAGGGAAVIRAMPNTPAAVGRGMIVACANANATGQQRRVCDRLLAAVGEVAWVEDEALIDAVTAVSGSGPAYVFYMIECLTAAGITEGLPADLAARLALVTVRGAGELAALSDEDPAQLRKNVTSPGGTTQAALDVLMAADGLAPLMRRTVAAAARRSRELAG